MNHSQTAVTQEIALKREVALAALKLSKATLEHGIELHRNSVVVDAYGFSAFASPDPKVIGDALALNLEPTAVRTADLQSRMTRMASDAHQRAMFIEAWEAAGVTCVMRNSGEEGNSIERLLPRLAHNTHITDQLHGRFKRMVEAGDIRKAKQDGQFGFSHSTNGVPLPASWETTHDALRFISLFRQLGVRMMHVTYNRRNLLGDGCAEITDAGLSDLGQHAIARMNESGVIVDLAHTGHQTSFDAAACTSVPIVISHATCAALHEHCRAKSDALIKAVADTGGLMGICAISHFLGGSGDINALLDHVDHAVKIVGHDHVAIGTDVSLSLPQSPDDAAAFAKQSSVGRIAPRYESFWPEGIFDDKLWGHAHMLDSLAWTNWPLFTAGLVGRGYSDEQIQKIIGLNMMRVLEAQKSTL